MMLPFSFAATIDQATSGLFATFFKSWELLRLDRLFPRSSNNIFDQREYETPFVFAALILLTDSRKLFIRLRSALA
jgi:hypothetical protein